MVKQKPHHISLDVFAGSHLSSTLMRVMPWSLLKPHISRVFFVDGGLKLFSVLDRKSALGGTFFGDGDSISAQDKKFLKQLSIDHVHTFPSEKDFSDTEAAVNFSKKKVPVDRVALFLGMQNGRPDHNLASLLLWFYLHQGGPWRRLIVLSKQYQVVFFHKQLRCALPLKTPCALFRNPLSHRRGLLTTTGLSFNLRHAPLLSPSHGISNTSVSQRVTIDVSGEAKYCFLTRLQMGKGYEVFWKSLLKQ